MKLAKITTLFLLLPLSGWAYDETEQRQIYTGNAKLNVDNINKTTETLRDPTIVREKLQPHIKKLSGAVRSTVDDISQSITVDDSEQPGTEAKKMTDPTRMSSSFRATMDKMTVRQTTTLNTTGAPPELPEISLAAIVYGNEEEYYAMLHVDDRTVLIKVGDKATFIDNNKIIEIVVQAITRNDVRLAVYPSNQLIVLR